MKWKSAAVCLYIGLVYFVSARVPGLHPLFFPTLGAFAYFFVLRDSTVREQGVIAFGAVLCCFVSSVFAQLHPSTPFFVLCELLTFWMIRRWRWNAPPIMAISLIPFFSHAEDLWTLPAASAVAIAGLMLSLAAVDALRKLLPLKARLLGAPRRADLE